MFTNYDYSFVSQRTSITEQRLSRHETYLGHAACCLVTVLMQLFQLHPEITTCLIVSQPGYV
jgi:hypothetical protein